MISLVVISHSRALAEALVALVKNTVSIDISVHAAGGCGADHAELGTDAMAILSTLQPLSREPVIVFMDTGSAILSAEIARDFLAEDEQANIYLCAAPLVEGVIAAAVQVSIGASVPEILFAAQTGLSSKQDHLALVRIDPPQFAEPEPIKNDLQPDALRWETMLQNEIGIHFRPAARIVQLCGNHRANRVEIFNNSKKLGPASGTNPNEILNLKLEHQEIIRFEIYGEQPEIVREELEVLAAQHFGDL